MIMMNHDMAYGDTGAFRVIPPQVSPKLLRFRRQRCKRDFWGRKVDLLSEQKNAS